MYVCMYVYVVRTSSVTRVCAIMHVCMYIFIRKYDVCTYTPMRTWVHVSCMRWASHESYTHIHTYDVAAHCATVPRHHRYLGTMSLRVRTYAHMLYLCLRVLHMLGQP